MSEVGRKQILLKWCVEVLTIKVRLCNLPHPYAMQTEDSKKFVKQQIYLHFPQWKQLRRKTTVSEEKKDDKKIWKQTHDHYSCQVKKFTYQQWKQLQGEQRFFSSTFLFVQWMELDITSVHNTATEEGERVMCDECFDATMVFVNPSGRKS